MRLPDTDLLLTTIVRDVLPGSVTVATNLPPSLDGHLPYVLLRGISGGTSRGPRAAAAVVVDVQAFATTRQAARELAEDAALAIHGAREQATVTEYGYIGSAVDVSLPSELPDPERGVFRFQTSLSLILRPTEP